MFFAQVAGCSDCGNVSIVIRNTGSTPITGVNMSFGSWFLGPIWSASIASMSPFPLLAGNSIVGFDGNSEVPNESNTFLVTAMFADGNATTESYDWPGGSQAVVRVQPYCCLDPSFNASSPCPTEFNSSIYNRLETLVTANPEFIALENGKNFTNPNGSFCGQSYNHYDVGVAFYHITDQLFLYCGNLQNVTDYISADLLRTPSGYSLSSMLLQTSNSTTNAQMCTTTVSPSTASTSD